ncbi:MAG TPA: hypothetical protein VF576_05430, partial [Rubricoccaceae bacterium]
SATFTALSSAQGWGGLRFEAGSSGTLAGVTVAGVRGGPSTDPPPPYPPYAAVEVVGATGSPTTVTLSGGTTVSGAVGANGVLATGSAANVTVTGDFTTVTLNDGVGVLATGGAQATVTGGADIRVNDLGGVRAVGYGSRATVTGYAAVDFNDEHGIRADGQAHAVVRSPAGTGNTSVSDNDGGPTARTGGSVDGGQCEPTGATGRPNRFERNYNAPSGQNPYDASARGGSAVLARRAFWGTGRTAIVTDKDRSSTITTDALAGGLATADPACLTIDPGRPGPAGDSRPTEPALAGRGAPSATVVALAAQAREAAWAGDTDGAFATLAAAAGASVTDDDLEAVFEAMAATLAGVQPASVVAGLEAEASGTGEAAPWAARALAVAYAASGRPAEAEAVASALTVDEGGTAHAAVGHGLLVRLAVEADAPALAVNRLAGFAAVVTEPDTAAVAAYGAALALVAASFPDADLSAVSGGAAGRGASGSGAAPLASAAVDGGGAVEDGLSVWPNPAAAQATVRVSVSTPARSAIVSVYDAVGRRVAALHDGPLAGGPHDLSFETSGLAPGVYVVVVRVSPEAGPSWTEVRRVTVAR